MPSTKRSSCALILDFFKGLLPNSSHSVLLTLCLNSHTRGTGRGKLIKRTKALKSGNWQKCFQRYQKWKLPYVIFMKHLWILGISGKMLILNQIWLVGVSCLAWKFLWQNTSKEVNFQTCCQREHPLLSQTRIFLFHIRYLPSFLRKKKCS